MNDVVIKGNKPSKLLIKPENDEFFIRSSDCSIQQLDISDFAGEVIIKGMRGKSVKKDLDCQVTIFAKWKEEIDWNKLGLGPTSFFKIYATQLSFMNLEEGVFSLPSKKNRHYEQVQRERKSLEDFGIKFE